jgi:hypothetical protein
MSEHTTLPVPMSWREIVEQQAEPTRAALTRLEKFTAEFSHCEDAELAGAFGGTEEVLAHSLLLFGADACRPMMESWWAILPQVTATLDRYEMRGERLAHHILNFAIVAECADLTRPTGLDTESLQPLLAERETFSDTQKRSMAFTALALGETAAAYAFIGAEPIAQTEPGKTFQFNLFELIRYLADALDQQRPSDWIEPAWLEYLHLFPGHLAAQAASWPDLFCFARVLARLRGETVERIADDLYGRIMLLADEF